MSLVISLIIWCVTKQPIISLTFIDDFILTSLYFKLWQVLLLVNYPDKKDSLHRGCRKKHWESKEQVQGASGIRDNKDRRQRDWSRKKHVSHSRWWCLRVDRTKLGWEPSGQVFGETRRRGTVYRVRSHRPWRDGTGVKRKGVAVYLWESRWVS